MSPALTEHIDYDFRPAAPGWRVAYLNRYGETPFWVEDLAGWLIQAEDRCDTHDLRSVDDRPLAERPRRVIAAVPGSAGELFTVHDGGEVWMILGPSAPSPTEAQAREEIERRTRTAS